MLFRSDFINGDPDRPVIVGRLFNKEHMPVYPLPAYKTVSGWLSKTLAIFGFALSASIAKECHRQPTQSKPPSPPKYQQTYSQVEAPPPESIVRIGNRSYYDQVNF